MWKIHSGSITGPYHERRGEDSQDYYASQVVSASGGDVAVVIATDGAGSHARSLEGATITTEELLSRCVELAREEDFSQGSLAQALDEVRAIILQEDGYREMGCTVAVAIVGESSWCAGVLGDAFIVLHHGDGSHEFLQGDSISEFANVTELITSKEVHPVFASGDETLRGVSASSDGLESMSIERGEPLPGFWNTLLAHMEGDEFSMDDFLSFLKGKGLLEDDTTLITALRGDGVQESA